MGEGARQVYSYQFEVIWVPWKVVSVVFLADDPQKTTPAVGQ